MTEKKSEKKKKFWTKKRFFILSGAFLFLLLSTHLAFLFLPLSFQREKIPKKGNLRVMTFNIAHGRGLALFQLLLTKPRVQSNLRQIAILLKYYKPDIVALQELDQNSAWNGRFDHLAYLAKEGGYAYYGLGLNCRRKGWYSLNYGNGILSKYPLVKEENLPFGKPRLGQKGMFYTEIKIRGNILPLASVHLDYKTTANRLVQAKKMVTFLKAKKKLPLLLGDLNCDKRKGEALAYLLKNLPYTTYPTKGKTFSVYWPSKRLDHILVPAGFTVLNCSILKASLSDHKPVMMDLNWPVKIPKNISKQNKMKNKGKK